MKRLWDQWRRITDPIFLVLWALATQHSGPFSFWPVGFCWVMLAVGTLVVISNYDVDRSEGKEQT